MQQCVQHCWTRPCDVCNVIPQEFFDSCVKDWTMQAWPALICTNDCVSDPLFSCDFIVLLKFFFWWGTGEGQPIIASIKTFWGPVVLLQEFSSFPSSPKPFETWDLAEKLQLAAPSSWPGFYTSSHTENLCPSHLKPFLSNGLCLVAPFVNCQSYSGSSFCSAL